MAEDTNWHTSLPHTSWQWRHWGVARLAVKDLLARKKTHGKLQGIMPLWLGCAGKKINKHMASRVNEREE